jgi:hypothetical protein
MLQDMVGVLPRLRLCRAGSLAVQEGGGGAKCTWDPKCSCFGMCPWLATGWAAAERLPTRWARWANGCVAVGGGPHGACRGASCPPTEAGMHIAEAQASP